MNTGWLCDKICDSCRTRALWFYIVVVDHNATDPVVQKNVIHFGDVFLFFPALFMQIAFVTKI
jgi:hypothetical protein